MTAQQVIVTTGLAKSFSEGDLNVEVLKGVSLAIATSESVAILGASGSGKSTLLHLLGGLEEPTKGSVAICGEELASLSEKSRSNLRNRVLGFVYQFHHLLPEFSALENVAMPLLIRGCKPAECERRAAECLERVGLSHRLRHRPAELSGGERQRTAIARALVGDPKCVLADEPTGNLDRSSAERALGAMLDLRDRSGAALVVVTHDEKIATAMDRVIYLEDGAIKPPK